MRYGICTDLENIELLEKLGFDYLEASVTSVMKLSEEELDAYKVKLKTSKIKCEAFNILFPKTMELVGVNADKDKIKEHLHKAFKTVSALGGQVVVFGSGKCRTCPDGYDYKKAYKELVEVYRITGEIAKEYGILIVIEPLSRIETNMICTMAEGAILEADVNLPNVTLLSDYFHVIANHDNINDIVTIGNFGHIHIAAGEGRLYPTKEENEKYSEFIAALKRIGYNARISIEGKTTDIEKDGAEALKLLKELEEKA